MTSRFSSAVEALGEPVAALRSMLDTQVRPALPGLQSVGLILTTACNMSCSYCYQKRGKAESLPWPFAEKALDILIDTGYRAPQITFFGGEPLLEKDLLCRSVRHVESRCRGKASPRFQVTTNGTLLDEPTLDFLARHRIDTTMSFDGVRAAQDLRGPDAFDDLDRLLHDVVRKHSDFAHRHLSIRITVCAANVPYLADSVAYLMCHGVHNISMSPVFTHDPDWSPKTTKALERQTETLFELCRKARERHGTTPVTNLRVKHRPVSPRTFSRPMCGAVRGRRIVIDVDGAVYGCSMFAGSLRPAPKGLLGPCSEAMRIGHITDPIAEGNLKTFRSELANIGLFRTRSAKYSSRGRCADCPYLAECIVCPASIGLAPDNQDPDRIPDHQCDFNIAVFRVRDRLAKNSFREKETFP